MVKDTLRTLLTSNSSVTDAAKRLGIGRPALSNMLNGNADLSIELALKIEKVYGQSADALLYAQLKEKIAEARQNG